MYSAFLEMVLSTSATPVQFFCLSLEISAFAIQSLGISIKRCRDFLFEIYRQITQFLAVKWARKTHTAVRVFICLQITDIFRYKNRATIRLSANGVVWCRLV